MANTIEIIVKVTGGDKAIAELEALDEAGKHAGSSADTAGSKFSFLSNIAENKLAQGLGKASIGFASILGAGGLGGIGAAAGVAGLGLVGFGALAAPTLDKVKNYLSQTGKQAQATWAQMDPTQRHLAQSMQSLEGTYKQAAKAFEPVVSSVVTLASTTARDLLPALDKLAPAGAKVITGFLTPLNKLLTSNWFENWVKQVSNLATQYAPELGKSLVGLLKVVLNLFTALGPSGAKSLANIINLFSQWVSALTPLLADGSKVLAWITQMMQKSPLLAAAILTIGAAIAIATGGMTIIIPAIALAVGAIMHLWDTSTRFRDIMVDVFADVAQVVLTAASIILGSIKDLADGVLEGAYLVVKGLSYIPGPTQHAMKAAAAAIEGFKNSTDKFFGQAQTDLSNWNKNVQNMRNKVKLEGDISDLESKLGTAKRSLSDPNLTKTRRAQIEANISQLERMVYLAEARLNQLNGYTANTYIHTFYTTSANPSGHPIKAGGGVVGAAAGGGVHSNLTMVGEHGRELVDLPPGSTVRSNPDTERMMSGGGGGAITLEVIPGGSTQFDKFMTWWLRNFVRIKGGRGPGSAQRALGQN